MTDAMLIPMNLPVGSEEGYIRTVNRIPMLERERELELARRLRDSGDLAAARELVLAHLRFVVRVARGYSGYGLAQSDLIQEGNIGLMKAVKRFDPEQGVRLVSFAVHWIRAEMHEFILRNWRIVRVATTKAQRKLFFNLRSAKKRLGWMRGAEIDEVARDLGVSSEEVVRMEERLNAYDTPFDAPTTEQDDDVPSPASYLQDFSFNPERQLMAAQDDSSALDHLSNALAELDARSRDIVVQRWLHEPKKTLHDLAAQYDISAERIRQIESRALAKLRESVGAPLMLPAN